MNKIFKIVEAFRVILQSKKSVLSFLEKGSSIASTKVFINLVKYINKDKITIIDVGANQGQFALTAKKYFPTAIIHSFEPLPEIFIKLSNNCLKLQDVHVYNHALGSTNSFIKFYQNSYSHASSALHVSNEQKKILPITSLEKEIEVPVKTLDNVFGELDIQGKVLLKLDVQGFEKEVLIGSKNIISKVEYLLFETSFFQMYNGEPLFDEMHSFAKELGFELLGPVGVLESPEMQILQMDVLYKKKYKTI